MTDNSSPALTAFEALLALREHAMRNPTDSDAVFARFCAENLNVSRSQLFQDILVVLLMGGKPNGYFVEFGAGDGITLSNTYLLEKRLRWNGILAEPARCWHDKLSANRSAAIDRRCVWSRSGERRSFFETSIGEFSTLTEFRERDFNKVARQTGTTYEVETVSLNDLLASHNAPAAIDYMSIDTEGSEWEILQAFDFDKYQVGILTVEHNYCEPDRTQIFDLLAGKGFIRILEPFSKFDDWYVQRSVIQQISTPPANR